MEREFLEQKKKQGKKEPDEQAELTLEATVANIEAVTDFVNGQLEQMDCPMKAQMQIDVAIDELFGNIAHYAYESEVGFATVQITALENMPGVRITFIDGGTPYDPLARETPDITLSAADREIGGLGIFMVKKLMDEIHYTYQNGKNKLTIIKKFERK